MSLEKFQQQFTNMLKSPMQSDSRSYFDDDDITNIFDHTADQAQRRLNIYRLNSQQSLRTVLKNAYPFCYIILGQHNFMLLAQQCVRQFLPTQVHLLSYGAEFLTILQQDERATTQYPWLYDLACLEWARHTAFFAAPHVAMTVDVDPQSLLQQKFMCHQSMTILPQINEIAGDACDHMFYNDQLDIAELQNNPQNIDFIAHAETRHDTCFDIFIARGYSMGIFQQNISSATYKFLIALHQKTTLDDAITQAIEHDEHWDYKPILNLLIKECLIIPYDHSNTLTS